MSRITVITSCTSRKASVLPGAELPAAQLYTGDQHARLMVGAEAFRASTLVQDARSELELWILSAGHGLISENDSISSYDATFSNRPRAQLAENARRLGVPRAVRSVLSRPFDLGLLLLGSDYVRATELDKDLQLGGPTIAFASAETERLLPAVPGLRIVRVGVEETRRFAAGLVGLKGELARRLLAKLAENPADVARFRDADLSVLDWLAEADHHAQLSLAA